MKYKIPRVNPMAICFIFISFLFILLVLVNQKLTTPSYAVENTYHSRSGGRMVNILYQQNKNRLQTHSDSSTGTTNSIYNSSVTVKDILELQRKLILQEMDNYEYQNGRFGVDAEKLADLVPETGGTPVRSIIITTWRSGSTFLGDILNAMPANYYHYEPLLDFGIVQIRDRDSGKKAIKVLKDLLSCNYNELDNYLNFGREHDYLFSHNHRLWKQCKMSPHNCFRPEFLNKFCKLFPMQSMKVVRIRLALAEELLMDERLNARILLLVRDPRGTIQSRKHRDWCPGNPDCSHPPILCQDMVDDYEAAAILYDKFPNRFRAVRYEDLSLNINEMTQDLLQFYGLPFDPAVEEFLNTHTKEDIGGVSSTYRDSKTAPFHWIQDLQFPEVDNIQRSCEKALDLWGYKIADFNKLYQKGYSPLGPFPFAAKENGSVNL